MKDPGIAGVGFGAWATGRLWAVVPPTRSGNVARRQVPLVIKDRWCSCRSNRQRGLNRSAHAGIARWQPSRPAQMAHPKGLKNLGLSRGDSANRTPFVWTDAIAVGDFRAPHRFWSLNRAISILKIRRPSFAEVSAQVAKAQTIVVAEYRGIAVGDLTMLRANARAAGVYLRVLKNTLARRAVEGTPFALASRAMTGPLIYGISEDAVASAWVLNDFAKTNDKLVLRAGSYWTARCSMLLPSRRWLRSRAAKN